MQAIALATLALLLCPALLTGQQPQVVREWLAVTPEGAGAQVQMPLAPSASERVVDGVNGEKVTVKLQISELEGKHTFVFGYHDQAPPVDAETANKTLDGAVTGAVARTFGDIEKASVVRSGGLNGREVTYTLLKGDKSKMRVAARFFLDGGRVYQLTYVAPADEFNASHAKKFLESFKHLAKQ